MIDSGTSKLLQFVALAGLFAAAMGCDHGTLEVEYGETVPSITTGDDPAGGATLPDGTPVISDDDSPVPQNPREPSFEEPEVLLHNATVGERCIEGRSVKYLVLSDSPSACADDAERIDAATTSGDLVGAVAIELDGNARSQQTVRYCPEPGNCEELVLDLNVVEEGGSLSGSWTGSPQGEERTVEFSALDCAYDEIVDPLPGDTLAAGISIDDVAVYQGVKIPIIDGGALVTDRNAPIVAGRPGAARVFVTPEADWQERDILVRLTVGEMVKEQTFRPTGPSMETSPNSTVNFDFAPGELPADATFSVELIEAQACADVTGEIATARLPEPDDVPLQSEGLAKVMEIVLVPIQYDADGSGRLPDLSNTTVDRFKQEAFTHYPVEDVEVTVRDPVATGQGLAPNGGGFAQMLNLCLSVRANDNPGPDVYYYCVIQPANSAQDFCGGGCVGGVAPVPGANDVQARGGIGISFNGDGEGIFVHEIGHALGRPHSPCGGASGTDPNYPYAQGLIGSWGYDIMNGQLFEPTQRADFMGYCNPTWVSDYTYGRIFDRLRTVLGTQSFMVQTTPTRWRTAVMEIDGSLQWGEDVVLGHLPTGLGVNAELRDPTGVTMGSPEVYVTPVADIDAVLLTIEDTGFSGGTIDIPGIGEITVQ